MNQMNHIEYAKLKTSRIKEIYTTYQLSLTQSKSMSDLQRCIQKLENDLQLCILKTMSDVEFTGSKIAMKVLKENLKGLQLDKACNEIEDVFTNNHMVTVIGDI